MGDNNLAPIEMGKENLKELVEDYHYRCTANLGPCTNDYCDEDCCIRTCNSYYNGLNPEPKCIDLLVFPYKFCLCLHDCY